MSPFSHPTRRAKKVLDENAASSAAKASSAAAREFLGTQQTSESTGADGLDDSGESTDIDQAQFEHDTLVVQDMVFDAIAQMLAAHSVTPTKDQLRDAQAIMPAVSRF
jgi:hypothetical protein